MTTLEELERRAARAGGAVGGAVLAAATRGVAAVRPARKPLHPDGSLVTGRIYRQGSETATGVAWLDEAGEDEVVARLSRAVGLPTALPDIHGLAVRVQTQDGYGDLLFATTGRTRIGRFVLTPSRGSRDRPMTTLLPYDTASGPLLLGAFATGQDTFALTWATPLGEWSQFGVLILAGSHDDQEISFDPVRNQIEGLRQYAVVRRLREPAYATARSSRG
jgi:hypothetical protein